MFIYSSVSWYLRFPMELIHSAKVVCSNHWYFCFAALNDAVDSWTLRIPRVQTPATNFSSAFSFILRQTSPSASVTYKSICSFASGSSSSSKEKNLRKILCTSWIGIVRWGFGARTFGLRESSDHSCIFLKVHRNINHNMRLSTLLSSVHLVSNRLIFIGGMTSKP